jgi:hypothetical protein
MKYSEAFERDWNWYLKYKDVFNFDGLKDYYDKKGNQRVIYSELGKSAKECFYQFDTNGKIISTNEPDLLYQIIKCKGSLNLNIKMWAEDWSNLLFFKFNLEEIKQEFELLDWQIKAIENQRDKILRNKVNEKML